MASAHDYTDSDLDLNPKIRKTVRLDNSEAEASPDSDQDQETLLDVCVLQPLRVYLSIVKGIYSLS